jgi:hypothetical protein
MVLEGRVSWNDLDSWKDVVLGRTWSWKGVHVLLDPSVGAFPNTN